VAVLSAAAASATARPRERILPAQCLGTTERLKTLSDPERNRVRLRPRQTTIAALSQQAAPHPTPRRRRTPYQRQAWKVIAQITQFRLLPDGSIELILYDANSYVRAGLPSPKCLSSRSRARRAILATRASFVATCGDPKPVWQNSGAVVSVSGVGFWSSRHLTSQAAQNGAELQPITSLQLIVGCR
jgi:hypothetical protein